MVRVKPGVSIRGIRAAILFAIERAGEVWGKYGLDLVLTSGSEGKHSAGSLHYVGLACDLRLPPADKRDKVLDDLRAALGPEYDVVIEADHIHVEFQPKTPC